MRFRARLAIEAFTARYRGVSFDSLLATSDVRQLARARLLDARILFWTARFDGAFYLCGYAIELSLKAAICDRQHAGFPQTRHEFQTAGLQSMKIHDLESLLADSGMVATVKPRYLAEWSMVLNWNPEIRYQAIGHVSRQDAADMIRSAKTLLGVLL